MENGRYDCRITITVIPNEMMYEEFLTLDRIVYDRISALIRIVCVYLPDRGADRAVLRNVEREAVTLEHRRRVVDVFHFYVDDYLKF